MNRLDMTHDELKEKLEEVYFNTVGDVEECEFKGIVGENYEELPLVMNVETDGVFVVYLKDGYTTIPYYWGKLDDHGENYRFIPRKLLKKLEANNVKDLEYMLKEFERKNNVLKDMIKSQRIRTLMQKSVN